MPKLTLDDIEKQYNIRTYSELVTKVSKLISSGRISPVKASGLNGKSPSLYNAYRTVSQKKDYSELEEELKFRILPPIVTDYYLKHLSQYARERDDVVMLNLFFRENGGFPVVPVSANERSFQIWHREKFLIQGGGRTILRHCGLEPSDLCLYETSEPLAYYTHSRMLPQNILILENKDPFYGMRKKLIESTNQNLLDTEFQTLIYGAGKGILRSFRDYSAAVEPYMTAPENHIYYWGDLDYEGIGIYESLAESFEDQHAIMPFVPAYEKMIDKALKLQNAVMAVHLENPERAVYPKDPQMNESIHTEDRNKNNLANSDAPDKDKDFARYTFLPLSKEAQNQNISGHFFSCFSEDTCRIMKDILQSGRYIPQEIINIQDY